MKKERAAPASGTAGTDPRRDEEVAPGESWIILQPLSPTRAHASWRAEERVLAAIGKRLGASPGQIEVRIHALPPGSVDPRASLATTPVRLDAASNSSTIDLPAPGMRIVAELCAAAPGPTAVLARSNVVDLPSGREPSMVSERTARVRGSTRGDLWKPRTSPASAEKPPRVPPGAPAESLQQPGSAPVSPAEPGRPAGYEETSSLEMRFTPSALPETFSSADVPKVATSRPYLSLHIDLVVHGRAQPGTEVVIDGVIVPVRADGTFEVRFALPHPRETEPGA
jgi:hypothetical protein